LTKTEQQLPQFNNLDKLSQFTESGIYEVSVFSIIPRSIKIVNWGENSLEIEITPNKVDFNIPSESFNLRGLIHLLHNLPSPLFFEVTRPDGK